LLTTRTPARAIGALAGLPGQAIASWDPIIEAALHGKRPAVRDYVARSRSLIRALLDVVHSDRPELVARSVDGSVLIRTLAGTGVDAMTVLDLAIPDAPFSPWTNRFGVGGGTALALLSAVRAAIPGVRPLPYPADLESGLPPALDSAEGLDRYRALVWEALRENGTSPLAELQALFDLDHTDTARLFGVTRQAVADWLRRGVPANRSAKVVAAVQTGRLLEQRLRPGLLPGVARRPAAAYGNRSMLDLIAADRHEELLERTRHSFDWSTTG
jgi:hypothetical protein